MPSDLKLHPSESISFSSFGVPITIETNDHKILDKLRAVIGEALPGCFEFISEEKHDHKFTVKWKSDTASLYQDCEAPFLDLSHEQILSALRSRIRLLVAEFARDFIFVHAGVVAWKEKGIVMPGNSMDGKSTLVKELLKLGAVYYSDEYAIFDKDGLCHPFPKTLSCRRPGSFEQTEFSLTSYGGEVGNRPISPDLVVFTKYESDANWKPDVCSDMNGVIGLIQYALTMRTNPTFGVSVLHKVASRATFIVSKRNEAATAASEIIQFLDSSHDNHL